MSLLILIMIGFLACLYIFYLGIVTKPERSLYAYLILWLFFPKLVLRDPVFSTLGLPEVQAYYVFVEPVAALAILVALLARADRKPWTLAPLRLRRLALLFLVTGAVSLIYSLLVGAIANTPEIFRYGMESAGQHDMFFGPQEWIVPFGFILFGFIFLYGCMAFITKLEQVETMLLLFVLAGIEMTVESITLYYLGLFPALHPGAINLGGRFQSLTQNNFDTVGLVMIIAICCAVYFIWSRRAYPFLLGIPFMIMPILATFERAPLLAVLVVIAFVIWISTNGFLRVVCASAGVLVILSTVLFDLGDVLANAMGSALAGEVRDDYTEAATAWVRMALWGRAFDLFIYWFPFGIGPGLFPFSLNSTAPGYILDLFDINNPDVIRIYQNLFTYHSTTAHNLYIEFMVEHGLLGVIALCAFVVMVIKNYSLWRRHARAGRRGDGKVYYAHVSLYAIFVGIGAFYCFESHPNLALYFLLAMFLYFSFLLNQLETPVPGPLLVEHCG
jgi:O-antigen ligase